MFTGFGYVLTFAAMGKLTVLTIMFAAGFALAPAANADAVTGPFAQHMGPFTAPFAQESSSSCDPNYSGACVPIASDVDCAGGSGNGPAYVSGPVYVVGRDIYGLDRDGDGVGCQ